MILEFTVRNFNSFKEEQIISFLPSDRVTSRKNRLLEIGNDLNIITNMLITGLTNSGKSNILLALDWLSRKVRYPSYAIEIETFKYDTACKWLYTDFKLSFLLDRKQYLYEVSINKKDVVKEKLSDITADEAIVLFNRVENLIDWSMYPTSEIKSTELYMTSLFSHINNLQKFFSGLVINYFNHGFSIDFFNNRHICVVNNILKSVDLGHLSLIKDNNKVRLLENDIDISSSLSIGTKQFFWLLHGLLVASECKTPVIIDMPLVIDFQLQEAMLKIAEALNVQLILVTTFTELFDILDADQISIFRKQKDNSTEIYSISDFDVVDINQKPLRRWYEAGKFDGIRNISTIEIESHINNYLNNIYEADL